MQRYSGAFRKTIAGRSSSAPLEALAVGSVLRRDVGVVLGNIR
jgi:hypothetical protein